MNDSLVKTIANISFANMSLFLNEMSSNHFDISLRSLRTIKEKNLNQEYIASAYSTHCEILISEKRNRLANESNKQLDLSEKKLLKDLGINCRKAFFRGIVYPAHMGAALRCLAWFHAFKGRKRIAKYFFKKAIKKHHVLDMRYEEGKSLRDYGLFLEDCNLPGEARDRLTPHTGFSINAEPSLRPSGLRTKRILSSWNTRRILRRKQLISRARYRK